jgi:hypothetical protein
LLCGLRRDASEIFRRHFDFENLTDVRVRFNLTRFGELDFILRIGYLISDNQICERADFTRLAVDVDAQITGRPNALFRRREQGIRHRLEQDFAFNSAFPLQVIEHGDKFGVHLKDRARRLKRVGQFPLRSARGLGL